MIASLMTLSLSQKLVLLMMNLMLMVLLTTTWVMMALRMVSEVAKHLSDLHAMLQLIADKQAQIL